MSAHKTESKYRYYLNAPREKIIVKHINITCTPKQKKILGVECCTCLIPNFLKNELNEHELRPMKSVIVLYKNKLLKDASVFLFFRLIKLINLLSTAHGC